MSHWAVRYIGLPYIPGGRDWNGVDCWGLLRLIYRFEWGISLPLLPGVAEENALNISHEILAQVKKEWVEVQKPSDGDAVAMSIKQIPHHVGVWVQADGGKILHCWKGLYSVAETIRSVQIKGVRTLRFFHYGSHHHHA